jgi:hypothetical protein
VEVRLYRAGRFGDKAYEAQSLFNGECLRAGNPATLGTCNSAGDDRFILGLRAVQS